MCTGKCATQLSLLAGNHPCDRLFHPMNKQAEYDSISKEYADLVFHDPSKRFVQYPWGIAQVPQPVNDRCILDVGCGEGSLPRLLAQKGAVVCGYDNSVAQIERAMELEICKPLGIEYLVADPCDILTKCSPERFDIALSTAVLHYARDTEHLTAFFSSTHRMVKCGGSFAALVCNPQFKRYEQRLYNRLYARVSDGRLRADFYDGDCKRCSAYYTDFSIADYETAARDGGWASLSWCPVRITQEGKDTLGTFWDGFEEDCPYIGIRCAKSA